MTWRLVLYTEPDGVIDDAVAAGLSGEAMLSSVQVPAGLLKLQEVVGALLLYLHVLNGGAGDEDQAGGALQPELVLKVSAEPHEPTASSAASAATRRMEDLQAIVGGELKSYWFV
ncbi:hypothetical protein SEVIR_6G086090v4 [Setaria viridis]